MQDLALALGDTSRQMGVEDTISVNVVKPATVWAFVVDSHLMGGAPVGHVFFSQTVGLLLEHGRHLNALLRLEGA